MLVIPQYAQNKKLSTRTCSKNVYPLIPIIKKDYQDILIKVSDGIVSKLAACINRYSSEFQLNNGNMTKVILYHEMM